MRWLQVAAAVLAFVAATGCPSEFGKDGRVAKAVHQDVQDQLLLITQCAESMHKEVCAPGKENSDACRRCGGP